MIKKRSIRIAISLFLLICFSAVAIPVDLFHNHAEEEVVCSDYSSHGSCQHKLHLSKKASYCFACAIHFDKTFAGTSQSAQASNLPVVKLFTEYKATAIVFERLFTLLRGPPSL